jgi:hypothetical protein
MMPEEMRTQGWTFGSTSALSFATSATDDACRPANDGERPADRAKRGTGPK